MSKGLFQRPTYAQWLDVNEQLRAERAARRELAQRLAEDGEFDRWARLAHLDRRNGTTEARDAIASWLDAAAALDEEKNG